MTCVCGRESRGRAQVHCPVCGSFSRFALGSKAYTVKTNEGVAVTIMVYRCRRCGVAFDDLDRAKCEAPALQTKSVKTLRQADKAEQAVGDSLLGSVGEDRTAKLTDLFKKAGKIK